LEGEKKKSQKDITQTLRSHPSPFLLISLISLKKREREREREREVNNKK
jgi:hypothetical protein